MKRPLISVLMTVYNHEKYLKNSIQSILNQTYKNWQLIIIENGSLDKSKYILKKIKNKKIKKFFLKKNIGRTNALNYGLKFCKGKYIAIMDSDDVSKKNRLLTQLNRMLKDKSLWLTSSSYDIINEKNRFVKNVKIIENLSIKPRNILFNNFIVHSSILFKRDLLKKIGNYPSKFKYAQDYAFYLKAFKNFKMEIIKKSLVKIRTNHKDSETSRQSKTNLIVLEELRLLFWVYWNFILSFNEKIKIYFYIIKKIIKLLKINFYLIFIPLITLIFLVSFFT